MGRKYKANKFAQRRRERKQRGTDAPKTERPNAYEDIVKENEKFTRYYKQMKIIPESEWNSFTKTLEADLPTTFRISGCRSTANRLLDIVENEFFKKYIGESLTEDEGRPFCLPWYPNNLAWQLDVTRKNIRKSENLYKLHNFLIAETTAGSISRQEAVSMIPPLVLEVKPQHKVLDMCAAPGSKTAQLIEALHAEGNVSVPSGFVIANDIANARCYMLVHQAKRLNSPCFMVINQDSSCMPRFKTIDDKDLHFDRILCDVPCTGDGTMRKNPDIWKKWNSVNGLNLHGVQYRIARRGAELLEVGGRLVYSTCSLNPVENEAVLHRLLKDSEGALELIDVAHLVPGLKYSPGVNSWELSDKECKEFYRSFDDVPEENRTNIRPQMFPPLQEEAAKFALNRCIRILPHFQNTGGFFVAALTKTRNLPWVRSAEDKTAEGGEEKSGSSEYVPKRKKRHIQGYKEDPFVFFNDDEQIWKDIKSFYDIDDSFKSTQLLTRSASGKKKNIYLCSDAIKSVVQANEENIKIINTGVKVFTRCDNRNTSCEFRLVNEGMDSMSNVIGKRRRIEINKDELIALLQCTDATNPITIDTLSEKTREQMNGMEHGSCMLVCKGDDDLTLNVVGCKGAKSLRAYVDTSETVHLLRLLGADVSKFEVNKFIKKNAEEKDDSEKNEEEEAIEGEENDTEMIEEEESETVEKEETK